MTKWPGQETENEQRKVAIDAIKDWYENPIFDTTSHHDLSILSELHDSGQLVNGQREGKWIIYIVLLCWCMIWK